jgi:branched-chain amino acid transport system ATP-binding protein
MTELLRLSDVDAYYGAAHILHGLSLNVAKGERVALLGRNGVGKTTTVNALLGIAAIRRGDLAIGGQSVRHVRGHTAAAGGIAVVPQGRKILANLTVEENLRLGAALRRPGPWTLDAVYGLFPVLRERADTSGTALSGGQQQMVAIGRALMANPDLLVLDEPSEGLAPVIVDQIATIMKSVADSGVAILLIEQHLKLVRAVCDRFYVLSKGAVVEEGQFKDVDYKALQSRILH